MTGFGVHSEVGKLRKVLVHRPGLSLMRLTPANHNDLLFDDVLWVERARWEHDQFVACMRERGGWRCTTCRTCCAMRWQPVTRPGVS